MTQRIIELTEDVATSEVKVQATAAAAAQHRHFDIIRLGTRCRQST